MKLALTLLRILLLGLVLYFLFREVSFVKLKTILAQSDWPLLLAAFAFYILKYIIQGIRWHNAAMAYDLNNSMSYFIKSQIEIAFLEMVFPVPDSEDALRILKLRQITLNTGKSMAIMLFDRIIGLVFLLVLLPFSLWFISGIVSNDIAVNKSLIGLGGLVMLILSIFYRPFLLQFIRIVENKLPSRFTFIESLKNSIALKISISRQLLGLFWVVAFGGAGTYCIWLLAQSYGINVPFLSLFLCIPLFYISQTFPLSYQGLGIYEATVVFIMQQIGTPPEKALALGTIHFLFHCLIILFGGLIFATGSSSVNFSLLQAMGAKTK